MTKQHIYIFGWPSVLGGADTKLADLITLLQKHFSITVIPNRREQLNDSYWRHFILNRGAAACTLDDLPSRLEGHGLSLSNPYFLSNRIAEQAKERGLKIVWSSEMMWHHAGELEAVQASLIDKVLYVSEIQKAKLSPLYGAIPGFIVGNYIDPASFPYKRKTTEPFTIGRLSRPVPEKFPEDFPVFYERLNLPRTRFRIMGWDSELSYKFSWHTFDSRWELLPAASETHFEFLHSLDLFVYPLGHRFVESWGRSTVEAMLAGCVPIVPTGHHLQNLVVDGVTGFVCFDFDDFRSRAWELYSNPSLRRSMSVAGRERAEHDLCDREKHLAIWKGVFETT